MATVQEVEVVISKILSDKAKLREEGVKELLSYLDASGGVSICPLLDRHSVISSHSDKVLSSTWPGIIRALCQCNKMEYASSKKRAPKLLFSKALRNAIQKVEERIRSGAALFLPQDLRNLFSHLLEGVIEVPNFLPDYSHVICQLVTISDYCAHMTRQVYAKFVLFFLEKLKSLVDENAPKASLHVEEAFRMVLVLQSLLQNPPDHFMEKVRDPLIEGFGYIFSNLRGEGRVAKKLLASVNILLLKDGVNLGDLLIDLHNNMKSFVSRTWKTTRDRELKDELVLYGRLQLKLGTVIIFMEGEFIDQMLQLVVKELDQTCAMTFLSGSYRIEGGRESGKCGYVTEGMYYFLDFSASIFFQASLSTGSRSVTSLKKQKMDDILVTLSERLNNGNPLWWGSFCLLVRSHYQGISTEVIYRWLKDLCIILERSLSEASRCTQNFESLVWTLRCLQELSIIWPLVSCGRNRMGFSLITCDESKSFWESIWMMVLQWIPLFSGTSLLVEESFKLLGHVLMQNLLPMYPISQEFWALKPFTETPSRSILFFVASFFSNPAQQIPRFEDQSWKKLLTWIVLSPDKQDHMQLKIAAILALSTGCVPQSFQFSKSKSSRLSDELDDWAKVEHLCKYTEKDLILLDEIANYYSKCDSVECFEISRAHQARNKPFYLNRTLLKDLAEAIVKKVCMLAETKTQDILEQSLNFASMIVTCISGVLDMLQKRGQCCQEWSSEGIVCQALSSIIDRCTSMVKDFGRRLLELNRDSAATSWLQSVSGLDLPNVRKGLSMLLFSQYDNIRLFDDMDDSMISSTLLENLLLGFEILFKSSRDSFKTVNASGRILHPGIDQVDAKVVGDTSFDADFDVDIKAVKHAISTDDFTSGACLSIEQVWMMDCVTAITLFAQRLPERTYDILSSLLPEEHDPLVKREIILSLCKSVTKERVDHVASLVDDIGDECQTNNASLEMSSHYVLTAIDTLFETLLASNKIEGHDGTQSVEPKCGLSDKVFRQIAKLLNDVGQSALLFWHLRWKFAESIQRLNALEPSATEVLLDKFLSMLHDIDYRVRWVMSRMVGDLFQAYTGHEDLFQDVCSNISLKMVMTTKEKTVTAAEVTLTSKDRCHAETSLITFAEVAAVSEKVEVEAVFMICANAAIFPPLRFLSRVILDRLAKKLLYPNRWKYLSHHLCSIFSFWIKVQLPLPTLVEVRDLMVCNLEPVDFLNYCCQWVLPSLLIYNNDRELEWLAKMTTKPIPDLVKEFSAAIFSALLPLYCRGDGEDKRIAVSVLQGKMLALTNMSEDDRDILIKKNMVSIVNGILQLCSSSEEPAFPLFSKKDIMSSLQIVVDGFCGSEFNILERADDEMIEVKDILKIFRADRVFMFVLQIHLQIESAYHSRHRRAKLAGLACLMHVIKKNVTVPIICRYVFHILLQSLKMQDLQETCCQIAGDILNMFSRLPKEVSCQVLGPQLQLIVSHLVSICVEISEKDKITDAATSPVFMLLERITIHGDPSTYGHIKELPPFPDLLCLERIRTFHSKLCKQFDVAFDFEKYVMMLSELPCSLQLKSLQNLHHVFATNKKAIPMKDEHFQVWSNKKRLVVTLLEFVRLCLSCNDNDVFDLAGDFIARMEIEDPNAVVVEMHRNSDMVPVYHAGNALSTGGAKTCGIPEDLCRMILHQLKNYLTDEDVLIIELAAQTLKGLLATEKGHSVLKNMEAKETVYIEAFSKGINPNTVGIMLNVMKAESTKKLIPLEDDMLWDVSHKGYDAWVCLLVYSLIHYCEDTLLRLCQGIAHCKVPLAESLLPHVLGCLAATTGINSNICKLVSSQVDRHIFCEANHNTRSIQLFLDALNELRHCDVLAHMEIGEEYREKMSNAKVYWLDIDYLKTAKAAHRCGAYFTSILYIEHWCEEQFGRLTLGEPDFSDDEELPAHVELLLDIYSRINEPDGVYGVVQSHKLMPQVLISEHEGNWSRAVEGYDLLIRNRNIMRSTTAKSVTSNALAENIESLNFSDQLKYNKGLIRSLQKTGCEHVLRMYCKGLSLERERLERNIEFQELQYESAWRAGNWDFYNISPKMDDKFDPTESPTRMNFHSSLFCCLQALYHGDHSLFFSQIKIAKKELVKVISLSSLESASNIFPSVIKLQILDSLCKSWGLRWKHVEELHQKKEKLLGPYIPSVDQMMRFDQDWKRRLGQMQYQFDLFEPYVAFRKVLHQILGCEDSIHHQILEFAIFARKAGRINQAAAAIYELKQYYKQRRNIAGISDERIGTEISASVKVEEAKVLWAQGQRETAVNLLKYVINHCHDHVDSASVYCLTGKWLADTHSDSSRIILTQYLQKAVGLFQSIQQNHSPKYVELKSRACYRLAHYADSLYRSYKERLSSNEWQNALRLRKHREKEVEMLRRKLTDTLKTMEKRGSGKKGTQDEKLEYAKKVAELQKQLSMDNEEAQRLQNDKDSFLRIALESYLCCLATSDKYDLIVVFKITSLWFNLSGHTAVIDSMLEVVKQVKSYKFLPLVYQIASRLGSFKDANGSPSFQYALTSLVEKMAVEHPYHTVYQLLALSNGDRIKDKQRSKAAFIIDRDKKQAAESLLNALMSEKKEIIQQMKQLVEIYIRLAEIEVKKEDMNKKLTLPRDIRGIRQLELVPVITAPIPVSPNATYPQGSFPFFKGLSDRVTVMMGINAPKVVECLGSDGHYYRQLAKSGNDDLRQDAVMEQLFSLVNSLLQHHPDTQRRKLGIRTYKVVPFTPSAGVLEWVDGTIPLGEYLLGSNRTSGAHARYRQGDWPFPVCRKYMLDQPDKQSAFQLVCENFCPVFHYFFLEKFSHPAEWFSKRLAYTRSVAASSMVGYIVGLGDRHAMNILIDQQTAEVVHIDLGVAFEQGLMLKMPERVPFRLTRDVVDGMGVTGVDGVFRRCCEETLTVMRANKDALLTIIEVFIHDPLYNWALSPLKALQRQKDFEESKDETAEIEIDGEASEGNKDAARALMRVKQKLDGYEGGDIRSVQGQVQQLIQDAQDSDKLCQMFPGWGAWL